MGERLIDHFDIQIPSRSQRLHLYTISVCIHACTHVSRHAICCNCIGMCIGISIRLGFRVGHPVSFHLLLSFCLISYLFFLKKKKKKYLHSFILSFILFFLPLSLAASFFYLIPSYPAKSLSSKNHLHRSLSAICYLTYFISVHFISLQTPSIRPIAFHLRYSILDTSGEKL